MRTIIKICKAELKYFFYSPVVWFILVVLAVQAGLLYSGIIDRFMRTQLLGYDLSNLTLRNFFGRHGFFSLVQNFLYLYIPLLTMGVMSREYSSGSVKLLYSSPISNLQIVLGKYFALIVCCFSIIVILSVYALFSISVIENVDITVILSGLLGIFLLICAYSAVGLFVSSLTSYQVVAAIGTMAILALLNYVRTFGQDVAFIRDITYWLALPGRSDKFISGLICSEDVIYFFTIIILFISLTVLGQMSKREKEKSYVMTGKILGILLLVFTIGYFSSQPKFMRFYDVTRTKQNTLTKSSQEVINQLEGGLKITTYVNLLDDIRNYWAGLPRSIKRDMERYEKYTRFKPETKLNYEYYYHKTDYPHLDVRYPKLGDKERIDTLRKLNNWKFKISSPEEIAKQVDLGPENYRFVTLIERESGEKSFLRVFDDIERTPSEREITAALKRLVMKELPIVGFLSGHDERSCHDGSDRGYKIFTQEKTFRYSLINQGFDFENISLTDEIPQNINMLVIAEPKGALSELEMVNLDKYIERGGNMMILGEPGREDFLNPITKKLGVTFSPGVLVKQGRIIEPETKASYSSSKSKIDTIPAVTISPELMIESPTPEAVEWSYHLGNMKKREYVLASPTFSSLMIDSINKFKVLPLFECDSSWIEVETTNFADDIVNLNPQAGEILGKNILAAALSRNINNKEQRIIITGDADWISNKELGTSRNKIAASNYHFINASFFWLSNNEVPIDVRRPDTTDNKFKLTQSGWQVSSPILKWAYPVLLLIVGLIIMIRRRGR